MCPSQTVLKMLCGEQFHTGRGLELLGFLPLWSDVSSFLLFCNKFG